MKTIIKKSTVAILIIAIVALSGCSLGGSKLNITVISPEGTVDTVDPDVRAFVENAQNYVEGDYTYSVKTVDDLGNKPVPVVFKWKFEDDLKIDSAYIYYSKNEDMSNHFSHYINKLRSNDAEQIAQIYNFETGAKYYWQVCVVLENEKTKKSDVFSFETMEGPRILKIDGVRNARDLGGWKTTDGKVTNEGVIYRTAKLNGLSYEDEEVVTKLLGVKTEIDLRNKDTETGIFSPLETSINYINTKGCGYLTIFSNTLDVSRYLEVFTVPENYPILFHCLSGADRTGCLAFLLGALYGVSENDLIADYEITNLRLRQGAIVAGAKCDFASFIILFRAMPGDTLQDKAYGFIKDKIGFNDMQIYNMIAMMKGNSAVFVNPEEYSVKGNTAEYKIDLRSSGGIKSISANGVELGYNLKDGLLSVDISKADSDIATVTLKDGAEMPINLK